MKKLLLTCALGILMAGTAEAAPRSMNNCAYSPLQTLVRDARDATQILNYINQGVVFDEVSRCGGTLMQLAILRGNPQVLLALLEQDLKRAAQIVSLDDFPIMGAPKRVPLWFFAAYYAPNEQIIDLMKQAMLKIGANIAQTDENGRGVLWYIEQNPVLRQTDFSDRLNVELLTSLGTSNQGGLVGGLIQPGAIPAPVLPSQTPALSEGSLTIKDETKGDSLPPSKNQIVEPTK